MSVCGEFAEHVWKPGSCKNCFHPRSAHGQTGTAGSACVRTSLIGEDEDGVTSPSPYSKPTIAVRPTMMNMDITMEVKTDINMNTEQDNQKTSAGLKKALDLAPLYIDSNGCNKSLRETNIQNGKIFSQNVCSPTGLSKDCMIISSVFVSQEDGCVSQSPKENGNGSPYRQMTKVVKSTYTNGDSCLHNVTQQTNGNGDRVTSPLRVSVEERQARTAPGNVVNATTNGTPSTSPSPMTPDSFHESLSDSCSNRSSTDSLLGLRSPQKSTSTPPNGLKESEPIYAESTKRKRRTPCVQSSESETEVSANDNQRATITVMAAHTEENNRTFYLSSPDSAVSTQWTHFSPTVPKDSSSLAFTWPNSPDATQATPNSSTQPKPQSSPPVPPKINSRPPRLGTSSLSLAPLSELSFNVVLPPKDTTPVSSQRDASVITVPERKHRNLEGCIDEVEEEVESERTAQKSGSSTRPGDSINGPAVRGFASREWKSESSATPGTANKSTSQTQAGVPEEDSKATESINTSRDPAPPPPPPKKHHRVCNRLSGSNMDLERVGQQGSVENLSQSLRGLNCCTTASTDSLQALSDADSTLRSCPSPFPSSPFGSAPASPQPDGFPSNSLAHQLQPPPLPQKKLVNRAISAPIESGVKPLTRSRPRLPFSGSETNISHPAAAAAPPSSPVDPRALFSSSESLERPRTLGNVTSSSSPQLNTLPAAGSTLQLHALLSNMDSREGIYSKLGGLYAESLRRLALKCEEHFTRSQRNTLRFDESNWSLFKLTCNKPSCLSGDAVYYSASCASDTRNTYAVKICKGQTSDSKQAHLYGLSVQQSVPPHFSLQQDCGHFIACVPQSMLPSEERAPGPSEQERVVVITREVPHQTVADFVREWESFHRAQPEVYERRVCFLLLQLCTGLEHLKAHGVTHRDVCMENLLLVQHRRSPSADGTRPDPQQQSLPRLLISSFGKSKRRNADEVAVCGDSRFKRDHARLAPEIVSAAQYRKFDEFQTGILIYELLHRRNPFEATPALRTQQYRCEDLPAIPSVSIYSSGLQRLAHLLLEPDPGRRVHIQDAKRILQALLWGPRRDLLEQPWVCGSARRAGPPRHEGLLNWLDVKRALLMMKFAERSLEPERNAELEDWLCCQYFSTANPKSLCQSAELLYNLPFTH
ncbi:inactive tyrosine-protein kinase PRAG1 isoform X1 [Ctenopharyngodon idella]|uniref:inactive tyrosine-protein kinase PRAG1 isoform X1 n=1 Tax=Ctenopharyngodon idella TaxID=7959 RepID=UPI00222FF8BD|nr:inactive tyrosine-protein kinase PRAG1 isoform X1 [Ctenopharyngodon idella]XP_051733967.1 inactive tyrosine-protein kinase PRAG1 isoform X1 [Ctenopharyngodon idella]